MFPCLASATVERSTGRDLSKGLNPSSLDRIRARTWSNRPTVPYLGSVPVSGVQPCAPSRRGYTPPRYGIKIFECISSMELSVGLATLEA